MINRQLRRADNINVQTAVKQPMPVPDHEYQPTGGASRFIFLIRTLPTIQLVLDGLVLLVCGYVTYYSLVFYSYKTADYYTLAIAFHSLLTVMLMYVAGLYSFDSIMRSDRTTDRIVIACITSMILMIAAAFTIKISATYSRLWMAIFVISGMAALIIERFLVSWVVTRLSEKNAATYNVAVYGECRQVAQLLEHMKSAHPRFISIGAVFLADSPSADQSGLAALNKGGIDALIDFFRNNPIDDVIIAMPWDDDRRVNDTVARLRQLPVNIFLSADIVGLNVPFREPPGYFQKLPIFQLVGKPLSEDDVVLKQIMDLVLGVILLVVLSPLLLVVALLIRLDSPGPVIFKQKRLGFNNRSFDIYKFRTMTFSEAVPQKTVQATLNDVRVTRVGRILRKTSIDELPQLLNVLNGTMSLVGPRPHAIDHNEEYATKIRGYFARHRVKPGITGLAQVKGYRGLTDTLSKMEGRVKYDLEYADSWSLLLDMKILILTVFIAFRGTNAF
jgi:putative colanic acid biosysnthesis UDP-glucose lipid carrier transferase